MLTDDQLDAIYVGAGAYAPATDADVDMCDYVQRLLIEVNERRAECARLRAVADAAVRWAGVRDEIQAHWALYDETGDDAWDERYGALSDAAGDARAATLRAARALAAVPPPGGEGGDT